jgi:hypothetical protein
LDFNFLKTKLLNHFSDHICQLGNHLNASSDFPERVMMDLEQEYSQSNHSQATGQIMETNDQKKLFQYGEPNLNTAKY